MKPCHQEVELKLALPPAQVEHLCTHLAQFSSAQPQRVDVTSYYYDTPDWQLKRRGVSLRVRQADDGYFLTLKENGHDDAGQGGEWEAAVDSVALDLSALRGMLDRHSHWRKMLGKRALQRQLHPLFDTRVSRTIWQLCLPEGDEIELALDQGAIESRNVREQISEVELELKAGEPASLFDFALRLLDSVPMRLDPASKAERGYALCLPFPHSPPVAKAEPLTLSDGMTVEQGFRTIAGACLAHIQGNAAGVMHGDDPENVHQMRVGLRRLHALFGLFRGVLALPYALRQELDWLGEQLGAARDWEVLSRFTLRRIEALAPADAGLAALQAAAAGRARQSRELAAQALASLRYAKLMLALSGWLQRGAWRADAGPSRRHRLDAPLPRFAVTMLGRDWRRLLKRGRNLRGGDSRLRHRVRIAARKVRYSMEFFQSLYRRKQAGAHIGHLSALQDELGWLNDAAVADLQLRELEQEDLAVAIAYARGYLLSAQQSDRLGKLWQRVARMHRLMDIA
ncbi:triphosphatase [Oxalobacteraceae bacterium GrIS 1.11]